MARECFGYGSWNADYWFVGPEQGNDKNGTLPRRVDAWCKLQRDGLSDCKDFHRAIDDLRWHDLDGKPPRPQSTWKQLIRLLLTYQAYGEPPTLEQVRSYQAKEWGRRGGETCVIELSGIPANTYAAGVKIKKDLFSPHQLHSFVTQRMEVLKRRLKEHPPRLVVMYGERDRPYWEELAGFMRNKVEAKPAPRIAILPHPTAYGMTNEFWSGQGATIANRMGGQSNKLTRPERRVIISLISPGRA